MTARNPVYVQQGYRFYADTAAQASATALANENTAANITIGTNFRLVVNIGDTNNANQNHTTAWKLQFAINGGTFADVGSASAVRYANSAHVADGNNYTTQRLAAIAGSTWTSAWTEFDSNNTLTSQTWTDDYTEYEFCLLADSSGVSDTNTLTFRLVTTANVAPNTITNTPTATAVAPVTTGEGGDPGPIPSIGLALFPIWQATLSKTLDDATVDAVGGPVAIGTLLVNLDAATRTAGTGTVDVAGTLDKTLADATVVSAGDVTGENEAIGGLNKSTDDATSTGTVTVDIAGTLAKTLDNATLATAGGPTIVASLTKTLEDADPSASGYVGTIGIGQGGDPAPIPALGLIFGAENNLGTSENPAPIPALGLVMYQNSDARVATLSKTLANASVVSTGFVELDEPQPYDFDSDLTRTPIYYPQARNVDWWTTDVQNRADTGGAEGVVDAVLAPATSSATVTVDIVGSSTITLAAATSASTANVSSTGTLAKTLADATVVGVASVDAGFVATVAKTLDAATVSATGGPLVDGRVVKTLAAVTVVGRIDISGGDYIAGLTKTLGNASVVSVGNVRISGATTQTLGDATVGGSASVLDGTVAALTQILANASLSSAATMQLFELGVRRRHTARATEKKIGGATLRATERDIEGETVE